MTEQTSSAGSPNPSAKLGRGLELLLAVTALAWVVVAASVASHAAQGIALRLQAGFLESLLERLFLIFLLVVGYRGLDLVATRGRFGDEALPLPARPTWPGEWGLGAAVGWGICLVAVLPVLLTGHLVAKLSWQRGSFVAVPLAMGSILAGALAQELIFRGYPFLRFKSAVGSSWAALGFAVGFALWLAYGSPPHNVGVALVNGILLGLLLALAYLRTNALWVGWGLNFAYRAVAAVVLGLATGSRGEFGALADTYLTGPRWLTGGAYGLEAAYLTVPVLLVALSVLYTATREYAWAYTHPLILPAGYAVEMAPPAAHTAMEREAAPARPQLVQILPATAPPISSGGQELPRG